MKGTYFDPDAWRNEVPQQGGAIKLLTAIESGAITNATKEELQQALHHLLPLLAMAEHRVVLLANALENTRTIGDVNKVLLDWKIEQETAAQKATKADYTKRDVDKQKVIDERRAKVAEVIQRFIAAGKIRDSQRPDRIHHKMRDDGFKTSDGKDWWSESLIRADMNALKADAKAAETREWVKNEIARRQHFDELIREAADRLQTKDPEALRIYLCEHGVGNKVGDVLQPLPKQTVENALRTTPTGG